MFWSVIMLADKGYTILYKINFIFYSVLRIIPRPVITIMPPLQAWAGSSCEVCINKDEGWAETLLPAVHLTATRWQSTYAWIYLLSCSADIWRVFWNLLFYFWWLYHLTMKHWNLTMSENLPDIPTVILSYAKLAGEHEKESIIRLPSISYL